MVRLDERLFKDDLTSAEFRIGAEKGQWGVPDNAIAPPDHKWPLVILWINAGRRANAPDRFCVMLNADNYRTVPPTGTFWDPSTKATLELSKRPKGKPDSRVAMVFRVDWNNGTAFYHPYDRVAAQGHPDWPIKDPQHVWTSAHTIVDYLQEIHALLNSEDYVGV